MRWALAAAAAFWAVACSFPNHRHDLRIRDPVDNGGEGLSFALFQSVGLTLEPSNEVELVENGAVWDALEKEIAAAKHSVHVLTFIWRDGQPSDRLIAALEKKTKEGVACRVVVDPFGSIGFDAKVRRRLSDAGCDARVFRSLDLGPRTLQRNHRKLAIIDGKVAFTGGFCIYKNWLGDGLKVDEWRDTNVRIEGPAVRQMQLAFSENWQEAGGALLPPEAFPEPDALRTGGPAKAAFVMSSTTASLSDAERLLLLAIASAKQRLWISNAYFVPSTAIGDMLLEKVKEGVDVRVLAPGGRGHDQPAVLAAQRGVYARLLEGGVKIYEYQPTMMHAKTLVVDDRLSVVGSINMDPLSLKVLEEGSLLIDDPGLARALSRSFERDVGHALEIRWEWWRKRSLVERLGHQLSALIGRFL